MSTFSVSFPIIGVSFLTSIGKPGGSCIPLYASLGKVRHNTVILFQGNRCSVCYGVASSRNLVAGLMVGSVPMVLCRHFSILVLTLLVTMAARSRMYCRARTHASGWGWFALEGGGVVQSEPVNMGGSSSKKPFVGAHQQTLTGHDDSVLCCTFSPDSKWLATSSADYTVTIWSTKNFKPKHRLQGHHTADITAVSFSPRSDLLISCKLQKIQYFHALSYAYL